MAKKGVHLNIYRQGPHTWRCDIKINTSDAGGGFTARGVANTEMGFKLWDAVKGALTLARQALHNPAVLAAFPAGTVPALAVIEALHAAKNAGVLSKVKKQFEDPTLKKVARELDELDDGKRTAMSGGGSCLCDGRELGRGKRGKPRAASMMGSRAFNFPYSHPWADHIKQQIAAGGAKDGLAPMRALAARHPAIAKRLKELEQLQQERTTVAGEGNAGEAPNIERLAKMLAAQRAMARAQRS